MQTMIKQISTYNENVVHKLYNDNDLLRNRLEQMEKDISTTY